MKRLAGILGVFTGMIFSGCLTTLYPIFTEQDVRFDSRLLGQWQEQDEKDMVLFEKGTEKDLSAFPEKLRRLSSQSYIATYRNKEGNEKSRYLVFLAGLGRNQYLDYYPLETTSERNDPPYYKNHWVRMHIIYRVKFNPDGTFELSQFKKSYMDDLISKKQIRIRHETDFNGEYVITAPTAELQQYVLKYGDQPEAFEDKIAFKKMN